MQSTELIDLEDWCVENLEWGRCLYSHVVYVVLVRAPSICDFGDDGVYLCVWVLVRRPVLSDVLNAGLWVTGLLGYLGRLMVRGFGDFISGFVEGCAFKFFD